MAFFDRFRKPASPAAMPAFPLGLRPKAGR